MPVTRRQRAGASDPLEEILKGYSRGERVIRFIEGVLTHSKGEWAGKPFELLQFQKDVIHGLYDPVKPNGLRRIRNGLVFLPRKNGKTTLSAGIGTYETFCGGMGARVICAANSREQASELFTAAADAVDASEVLRSRSVIRRAQKVITDKLTRSTFKVVSAEAPTAHGQDLTCWIYDELHAAPDRELHDVLATSTGARREALGLVISTAGFDKTHSILGEVYQHAKRWQHDPSIDPAFYAYLAEADDTDKWDEEDTWKKANPAYGVFRQPDEMQVLAHKARQNPGLIDAFKRLYLNIWTESESSWIDLAAWDECDAAMPDEELEGASCYGGLDLASTTDLSAFTLLFPVGGKIYSKHWAWAPKDGIYDKELRDRVPYRQWADEGLIELTPGSVIDPRYVTKRVIELASRYRIESVYFDKWGADSVVHDLEGEGIFVIRMGQGYASMSAPTKALQDAVLSRRFAHGGSPLARWQATIASIESDPAGNIKIVKSDKKKHRKHVDVIVSAVMAMAGVVSGQDQTITYSGLRVVGA